MAENILLLVEDEPDLREALGEYFDACGFSVLEAGSAKEAYAVAATREPQIVLSDLSLPDCRGDAFLGEFHSRYPKCLLYVHSGDSSFVPSPTLKAAKSSPQARHFGANVITPAYSDLARHRGQWPNGSLAERPPGAVALSPGVSAISGSARPSRPTHRRR